MRQQTKIPLPGTFKPLNPLVPLYKIADSNEVITATIVLRRKNALPSNGSTLGKVLTREEYSSTYAASADDIIKVEAIAHQYNLTTVQVNLDMLTIKLSGTITDFEHAFDAGLEVYLDGPANYRVLTKPLAVAPELSPIIHGIFGIDAHPIANAKFIILKTGTIIFNAAQPALSFSAADVAKIYGFQTGVTGKGQCIGIIELGGGFRNDDIVNYFKNLNLSPPVVKAVSVDGTLNSPGDVTGADGEVMLDIQVAGTIAPEATLVVYFAQNTEQGFLDAVNTAIFDTVNKPSVISISWGAAEINWTTQALDNFNEAFKSAAAVGITVCAASGDGGSSDGVMDMKAHVDFPSSSPYVLGCGGTTLLASDHKVVSEVVWKTSNVAASGGGVSEHFPLPTYQENAGVPLSFNAKNKGRGVPDVGGNADPVTGYKIRVDGNWVVIGGTSAIPPLLAGLIALNNEREKIAAGFINPQLYANPSLCRDIIKGNNLTVAGTGYVAGSGYTAGKGWDACTGLGVFSGF